MLCCKPRKNLSRVAGVNGVNGHNGRGVAGITAEQVSTLERLVARYKVICGAPVTDQVFSHTDS